MSNSPCPICDVFLTESDCKYPLICKTEGCNFNMCNECTGHLLETSKEGVQEASDGNLYVISLQCPSCRSGFEVDLPDILLLRDAQSTSLLGNMPDDELNAADLRRKYSFRNDSDMSLLNHALDRYNEASGAKMSMNQKSGNVIKLRECSHGMNKSSHKEQSQSLPDIISERMKYTDSMLFQGLESCMTQSEQTFLSSILTQGSPEKLSQGAHILASIVKMNLLSQRNERGKQQSPSIKSRSTKTVEETSFARSHTKEEKRIGSGTSLNTGSNLSRSSTAIPRPNLQSKLQRDAAIRRKWKCKYPLPFRMPREVILLVDSDSHDWWNRHIRFLDDESTLSFLKYNQRYHQMTDDLKRKLVEDAFSTLYVSWGKVQKRDLSQNIGPQNIIVGLEFDALDRSLPDIEVPWRRVVISYLDRDLKQLGLRVGDVVTHVDGEPFNGNAEKLKFILSSRRSERTLHDDNFSSSISLVVNAEVGVAEALRLRSFMAKYQNER